MGLKALSAQVTKLRFHQTWRIHVELLQWSRRLQPNQSSEPGIPAPIASSTESKETRLVLVIFSGAPDIRNQDWNWEAEGKLIREGASFFRRAALLSFQRRLVRPVLLIFFLWQEKLHHRARFGQLRHDHRNIAEKSQVKVSLWLITWPTTETQTYVIQPTGCLLQPHRWRCVECAIHHERDVREEQRHIYVARTSNNRVIMACEFYCCLLPQCEALRTCRSGFSDRNSIV